MAGVCGGGGGMWWRVWCGCVEWCGWCNVVIAMVTGKVWVSGV